MPRYQSTLDYIEGALSQANTHRDKLLNIIKEKEADVIEYTKELEELDNQIASFIKEKDILLHNI